MNLFALSKEWQILQEMLEDSAGEITPEIDQYMDTINAKSIIALFNIQDVREVCQMGVKSIKDKICELQAVIKKLDRSDDNLRRLQVNLMEATGNKTMSNGQYKITLTQNPLRVEIVDETAIPSTYMRATVDISAADYEKIKDIIDVKSVKLSPDKKQIAEMYKTASVEVKGCEYVREANVRVS